MKLYCQFDSPVGELLLIGNGAALSGLYMHEQKNPITVRAEWKRDPGAFKSAREQLAAYFAGELQAFSLPLEPAGTEFQKAVWRALCDIPFGQTESYGALARRIGRDGASRAVGLANSRNPIGIVVPCHRVIGANGALTGYAGGLDNKRWLLAHEARVAGRPSDLSASRGTQGSACLFA